MKFVFCFAISAVIVVIAVVVYLQVTSANGTETETEPSPWSEKILELFENYDMKKIGCEDRSNFSHSEESTFGYTGLHCLEDCVTRDSTYA
jgi:hypothetical protein